MNGVARDIQSLQSSLTEAAGHQVLLMLTDNISSMLSVKREGPSLLTVRAHRMFLEAPAHVIDALGRWLAGETLQRDHVQEYIDQNMHQVRQRTADEIASRVQTAGRHYDLQEIHQSLNQRFMDNRSKAVITWGRQPSRKRVRSVRLGWFDPMRNTIGISRRLDRSDIPRYMIEFVVFHEMLHEVLGIGERDDGRRDIHGNEFRRLEKAFPQYERARAFERKKWG